jgi:iron complex transport system ATP-binding protein
MTLAAEELSVRVGGTELLHGVSLAVTRGEVLAVVGPNGAGKSTLLRSLAGDLGPSSGRVTMLRRPLKAWTLQERARCRAVLDQDTTLAFPYLVDEVVLMGRMPHHGGRESASDRAIVAEVLATVGCGQLADRTYSTLSGGERQRVQLARVLAQIWAPGADGGDAVAPRFLLLDEPTSNLDLAYQHAALATVRAVSRLGVGVLVVLHDLNLAAEYADRIALLKDGRVVGLGAPDEVLRPSLLEDVFDIPVLVVPHPSLPRPLVVPDPARMQRPSGR